MSTLSTTRHERISWHPGPHERGGTNLRLPNWCMVDNFIFIGFAHCACTRRSVVQRWKYQTSLNSPNPKLCGREIFGQSLRKLDGTSASECFKENVFFSMRWKLLVLPIAGCHFPSSATTWCSGKHSRRLIVLYCTYINWFLKGNSFGIRVGR